MLYHRVWSNWAYGAFAVKGQYIKPIPITLVKDRNGNVLEKADPDPKQVVTPAVANEMGNMLRAVVTEGTARNVGGAVSDAHGKTGTTQNNRDAWFVGYTPQLSTAVWVGYDDNAPMNRAYGGLTCGPIWIEFMQHALKVNPKSRPDFTKTSPAVTDDSGAKKSDAPIGADGMVRLKICPDSNLVATNHCPHWRSRSFKPEDAPTGVCNLHPGTPLSGGSTESPRRRRDRRTDATPQETNSTQVADVSHVTRSERAEPVDYTTPDAPKPQEQTSASIQRPDPPPTRPPAPAPQLVAQPARRPTERRTPAATEYVTLCADSGLRATPNCPRTMTRRLTASTPSGYCRLHR